MFSFTKIKEDELIIPIEAIILRVIANSNTVEDQNIKIKVRDAVQKEILTLSDTKSLSKTRNNIKKEISNIDDIVKDTLKEINKDEKWVIDTLKSKNITLDEIFYAFYKNNNIFIIKTKDLL